MQPNLPPGLCLDKFNHIRTFTIAPEHAPEHALEHAPEHALFIRQSQFLLLVK
jgi:hypothetical protein